METTIATVAKEPVHLIVPLSRTSTMARAVMASVVLATMGAGCGGDPDPAPIQASCNHAVSGSCTDYNGGLTATQLQQVQAQCTGTWSTEPCSAANLVGSCNYEARDERGLEVLGVSQIVRVYDSSEIGPVARDLCTSGQLFSIHTAGRWAADR